MFGQSCKMSVQGRLLDKAMSQRSKRVTGSFADQNVSQARVYNTLMLASRLAIDQKQNVITPTARMLSSGCSAQRCLNSQNGVLPAIWPTRGLGLGVVRG